MLRARGMTKGTAAFVAAVLALACPGQEAFAQAVRIARPAPFAGAVTLVPSAVLPSGASLLPTGAPLSRLWPSSVARPLPTGSP